MWSRRTVLRLTLCVLGALTVALLVRCATGGGDRTWAHQCSCDHLVYVQTSTAPSDVTVYTDGNPTGSGDQVAWALVGGSGAIDSIKMPDSTCGSSSVSWTPYPGVSNSTTTALSGPFTQPPGTVGS